MKIQEMCANEFLAAYPGCRNIKNRGHQGEIDSVATDTPAKVVLTTAYERSYGKANFVAGEYVRIKNAAQFVALTDLAVWHDGEAQLLAKGEAFVFVDRHSRDN